LRVAEVLVQQRRCGRSSAMRCCRGVVEVSLKGPGTNEGAMLGSYLEMLESVIRGFNERQSPHERPLSGSERGMGGKQILIY
jgi:hypothetical protein